MATKKVSNCVAVNVNVSDEARPNSITSNLTDSERILKEEVLLQLSDISEILFGERDLKLDIPPAPDNIQSSTWNIYVLSNLINEFLLTIRSRI